MRTRHHQPAAITDSAAVSSVGAIAESVDKQGDHALSGAVAGFLGGQGQVTYGAAGPLDRRRSGFTGFRCGGEECAKDRHEALQPLGGPSSPASEAATGPSSTPTRGTCRSPGSCSTRGPGRHQRVLQRRHRPGPVPALARRGPRIVIVQIPVSGKSARSHSADSGSGRAGISSATVRQAPARAPIQCLSLAGVRASRCTDVLDRTEPMPGPRTLVSEDSPPTAHARAGRVPGAGARS
jgi:hypothetical protein